MYSPELRSHIRALLREEAAHFEKVVPPAEVARRVVERMRDEEHTDFDWMEGVYAIAYDEACDLFKLPSQKRPVQLDLLIGEGVPRKHAMFLVKINRVGLVVPSAGGVMNLWGDDRMTRKQGKEAAEFLHKKASETELVARQLDELFSIPGYYK